MEVQQLQLHFERCLCATESVHIAVIEAKWTLLTKIYPFSQKKINQFKYFHFDSAQNEINFHVSVIMGQYETWGQHDG